MDVALGIIGRPELLFLDEPTTGFDPEARRSFWDLIRTLKSEGTTILLTTHYLDEAAQLGDRAGIIAGGKLIEIGNIDEIGGADARMPIVRWTDANGPQERRTDEPGAVVAELMKSGGEPRISRSFAPVSKTSTSSWWQQTRSKTDEKELAR